MVLQETISASEEGRYNYPKLLEELHSQEVIPHHQPGTQEAPGHAEIQSPDQQIQPAQIRYCEVPGPLQRILRQKVMQAKEIFVALIYY